MVVVSALWLFRAILRTDAPVEPCACSVHLKFELGAEIGHGSYGRVRKAVCRRTGEPRSVKSLRKRANPTFFQEFELLRRVNEQQEREPSRHNAADYDRSRYAGECHVMQLYAAYDCVGETVDGSPVDPDKAEFHLVGERHLLDAHADRDVVLVRIPHW